MVYQNKKCPHCGRTIEFMQSKGTKGYGSKIQQCIFCGQSYFDNEFREIEVEGIRFADKCKIEPMKVVWLVILLLALIFGRNDMSKGLYIGVLCVSLLVLGLCIRDFLKAKEKKKLLAQEREASAARLSNISYARLLHSKGKKVPQKYLNSRTDETR